MIRKKYLSILILILTLFIFNCSGKSRTFKDDDEIVDVIDTDNLELFKEMLKKYKYSAKNELGHNFLMMASMYSSTKILDYLLKDGKLNIDGKDNEGNTALVFAIEYGHDKNVELLLDYGANINIKPKNKSLFLLACRMGSLEVMKVLVEKGITITDIDENGRNGVMKAIYHIRNLKFVEYLIKLGIDINVKDNNGDTPLLSVCKGPNPNDYIKLLLRYGADPNIKDKDGKTALDNIFEITGDHFNSSPLLIEAGGKRAKDLP